MIITRFRHRAATFAAVNGMLLLMNAVTTQFHPPWALFPLIGWGFGLAKDYAKLWTAGYSWKDVANRPPAPDAIEAKTAKGAARLLAGQPASTAEFGDHAGGIEQARSDRAAVMGMLDKMTKAERAMLPEIAPTVDQLLERATDLARSLSSLERDIDEGQIEKIDARLAALDVEPSSSDSTRRKILLEQQKQKVEQLVARRVRLGEQLESSLLAMQNIRFDLLRLRSSGVAEALGDLTNATQQAKALSRDVDVAIFGGQGSEEADGARIPRRRPVPRPPRVALA